MHAEVLELIVQAGGPSQARHNALALVLPLGSDAADTDSWLAQIPVAVHVLHGCGYERVIADLGRAVLEIDEDFFGTPPLPSST
jgi:hypothetical protein